MLFSERTTHPGIGIGNRRDKDPLYQPHETLKAFCILVEDCGIYHFV